MLPLMDDLQRFWLWRCAANSFRYTLIDEEAIVIRIFKH